MKPGWYSQPWNPETASYFDGAVWGKQTRLKTLDAESRSSVIILPEAPSAPPIVPIASATARSTDDPQTGKKGGNGWWWGISAGAVLIVIGIVYGFQPAGSYCSAPFKDSNLAEYMDAFAPEYGYSTDYAGECVADLASATATTWVVIGLGVLVALVSALIMATIRSGSTRSSVTAAPAVQSMASKIEDLARLRDKGLVTKEEYEWKRQELLRS